MKNVFTELKSKIDHIIKVSGRNQYTVILPENTDRYGSTRRSKIVVTRFPGDRYYSIETYYFDSDCMGRTENSILYRVTPGNYEFKEISWYWDSEEDVNRSYLPSMHETSLNYNPMYGYHPLAWGWKSDGIEEGVFNEIMLALITG